jgi:hypothetical protein
MEADRRSYAIGKVLALRDRLIGLATWDLYGQVTSDYLTQAVHDFRQALPKGATVEAVHESLWHWLGRELTPELVRQTCWRLAGNLHQLKRGIPVHPWERQWRDEWVPVQFESARPWLSKAKKRGYCFQLVCLAGSPAGLTMPAYWTDGMVRIASRLLGFTPPWGPRPFRHGLELVNCRAQVLVESKLSLGKPVFRQLDQATPSGLLKHNRKLWQARNPPTRACPKSYTHPCHVCEQGYRDSPCSLSAHATTYQLRPCKICRADGWFDLTRSEKACVDCLQRLTYRPAQ